MTDAEAIELLLHSMIRAIDKAIPAEDYGLKTKLITEVTGLPWPVARGLLTQLKIEGYLETKPMFDDGDGSLVGVGWFLTPMSLDWLARDLEASS